MDKINERFNITSNFLAIRFWATPVGFRRGEPSAVAEVYIQNFHLEGVRFPGNRNAPVGMAWSRGMGTYLLLFSLAGHV